jgi:hypothetical protein
MWMKNCDGVVEVKLAMVSVLVSVLALVLHYC